MALPQRRYWFSYDFAQAAIHRTQDMVCGWAFGATEADAEINARQWSLRNYPNRPLLKTAAINLRDDGLAS